ncbi:MAG: Cold shock protein CspV [Candidatus Anoxychlamydiales bacterium]|nr:Cold shock protein CspV [Candidatus Anoxychlamydiales bacterium]
MFRQGTIKWYDDTKHYGFITEDGVENQDIFFHKSNILSEDQAIEKGQRVEFDVKTVQKGLEAIEVKQLNE